MNRMAKLIAALVMGMSTMAFAGPVWNAEHPRRTEVNARLANQNRRVNEGVRTGKLTPGQAAQIHAEDHAIRQQERAEAAEHGGHITKSEQRQLNREENGVSRQIYDEKHP